MDNIEFPITEIDQDKFKVIADLRLYKPEAITAALYIFSKNYFIHQKIDDDNNNLAIIIFESKNGSSVSPDVPKQFCNELIDQQLRFDVNKKFGHIRDLIVEEAFKPVSDK